MTPPQVPEAPHKDAFGVQLRSVALLVLTLCRSVTASRSDCINPVAKNTSGSASIAEPSGRVSAKDVRVDRHDLIPSFFLYL